MDDNNAATTTHESSIKLVQQEVSDLAAKGSARLHDEQARASATVDDATSAVGQQLSNLGEKTVNSGRRAGFSLRRIGKYLDETSPSVMGAHLVSWAKDNPGKAASIALGSLIVLRRALRSR